MCSWLQLESYCPHICGSEPSLQPWFARIHVWNSRDCRIVRGSAQLSSGRVPQSAIRCAGTRALWRDGHCVTPSLLEQDGASSQRGLRNDKSIGIELATNFPAIPGQTFRNLEYLPFVRWSSFFKSHVALEPNFIHQTPLHFHKKSKSYQHI